jgi:beta-ureidopropionase / N-carbamoyl-L-amino-acid hydrolase
MTPAGHPIQTAQIDGPALIRRIELIGSDGTTRLAYSEGDIRGRSLVMEMMRGVGLEVRTDPAGNIIGRREGRQDLPPLAFGSHVDTVRDGGRYDGVLGVMAGIECVAALQKAGYTTDHPLELIVFANEEGQSFAALCGSRAIAGLLEPEDLSHMDGTSRTLADAIMAIGGDPLQLRAAERKNGDVAAFLELHIEQGGVLESSNVPIGIVEGISGISYTDVRVIGAANHSGTTVMNLRKDALVAASALVLTVQAAALERKCRVATVGQMTVHPNATNIIPGEVTLTIEIRDLEREKILKTLHHIRESGLSTAERSGTRFDFSERALIEPVPCSTFVREAIAQSCLDLGLEFQAIPSGAGHDAQMMARVCPMGMIFVPSLGGVSHSPRESTSAEDCVRGAQVLLNTILRLDDTISRSTGSPK